MIRAIKKLLKDLLYTKGNGALDIARAMSLLAALTYLGGWIFAMAAQGHPFDGTDFGTGWGLVCAGSGGWIFARQTKEDNKLPSPASRPQPEPEGEMA